MASPSGGSNPPVKAPERPGSAADAAPGAATPRAAKRERTLENWFYQEPFAFDFFQSVRLLERLQPNKKAVGRSAAREEGGPLSLHLSLNFRPARSTTW